MKIQCGCYLEQIMLIPSLDIYFHKHTITDYYKYPWHFHISIEWIKWYFEITIGDYKGAGNETGRNF